MNPQPIPKSMLTHSSSCPDNFQFKISRATTSPLTQNQDTASQSKRHRKVKAKSLPPKLNTLHISTSTNSTTTPMSPSSRVSVLQQLSKVDGLSTPPTIKVCQFSMNPQKMRLVKESYTPNNLGNVRKSMGDLLRKTKEKRIQSSLMESLNLSEHKFVTRECTG
mmetsp:Transcript_10644/g.39733  ORF Transcript_10644/g.39733 Transcript_10644/m.39733 type:complete len:164 (-) Transcript_10644:326-817(-)